MLTREIERSQWQSFCDQFSRAHQGQAVSVESAGREFGVQANVRNLPLLGITAEAKAGKDAPPEIEVMVGRSRDAWVVTHVIPRPVRLRVAEWNDFVSAAVQIESEDGTVTLVQAGPTEQTLPPGAIVDDIDRPSRPQAK